MGLRLAFAEHHANAKRKRMLRHATFYDRTLPRRREPQTAPGGLGNLAPCAARARGSATLATGDSLVSVPLLSLAQHRQRARVGFLFGHLFRRGSAPSQSSF